MIQCIFAVMLLAGVWNHSEAADTPSTGIASKKSPRVAKPYFGIRVVDAETARGVPMVALRTVDQQLFYTDSAGWVAFHEPGLMGQKVFFHVSSPGYVFPKDGFGYRGTALVTTPGTSATIKISRTNLAQRAYRLTGRGIFRDTQLLGLDVPIKHPVLNGDVLGQDTVQATVFRDRIYWFWGDTNRPSYPLGQFKTSGATSPLPQPGSLSAGQGIDLTYFLDQDGFSRRMAPVEGEGAVWLHGLCRLRQDGEEHMIAHFMRLKTLGAPLEHGLVIYRPEQEVFERLVRFESDIPLYPRGQSLRYEQEMGDYIYFCSPFPSVRVPANLEAIKDPTQYETFTCLKQGSRFQLEHPSTERDPDGTLRVDPDALEALQVQDGPQLDRNAAGEVVWGWKANTEAMDARRQWKLIELGELAPADLRLVLTDPETGKPVYLHAGSVHWNAFRKRWIMIAEEIGGESSFLGEIWYAESDRLEGLWVNARHIVSHDRYSFYNPAHHRFLDEAGGKIIYFQGTYATTFSGAHTPTPRYDYNQQMYRLDLSDPKLGLPEVPRVP